MTEPLLGTHEESEGIVVVPSFARHETFHPRYGWLKKGFDAAVAAPDIFLQPDATTKLGVGKNMVRAIRYWCTAYKVLQESPNSENSRLRDCHGTPFGECLLGEDGWDPYLEDRGSLWLLHWQLLRSPCTAPAWFAVFNRFRGSDFTDETLANQLQLFCDSHPEWGPVAKNSLVKDARCLLRMYASVTTGRDLVEDTIDSPFIDLELIRVLQGTRRHYTLNVGPKRSLPGAILAYACVDFAVQREASARLTTITRLTHAPGSPGRAFQLTESALTELLERYVSSSSGLRLTQAAGTKQLVIDDTSYKRPGSILDAYYGMANASGKVAA